MNTKCPNCGIAHNCNFCPNCGAPTPPHLPHPQAQIKKKTSLASGLKIVGLSLIAIFVLFAIGMAGLLSGNNDKSITKQTEFQMITGTTADQEEDILKVLSDCGITVKSIKHDELLDDMNMEGETGYRISTDDINNIILYLKPDKSINIVRYADKNLYKDGELLSTINDYYVSYGEKLNLKTLCEDTIKDLLKSPSTAKFPNASKWNVWKEDGKIYIQSYVDAQNSFGAELRSEFQFIIDTDSNTVESLIFDGEEYISQ